LARDRGAGLGRIFNNVIVFDVRHILTLQRQYYAAMRGTTRCGGGLFRGSGAARRKCGASEMFTGAASRCQDFFPRNFSKGIPAWNLGNKSTSVVQKLAGASRDRKAN
jgi:hypothetical protein